MFLLHFNMTRRCVVNIDTPPCCYCRPGIVCQTTLVYMKYFFYGYGYR